MKYKTAASVMFLFVLFVTLMLTVVAILFSLRISKYLSLKFILCLSFSETHILSTILGFKTKLSHPNPKASHNPYPNSI